MAPKKDRVLKDPISAPALVEEMAKQQIEQKVPSLYPFGNEKFDWKRIGEARKLVRGMMGADMKMDDFIKEEIFNVVEKPANDAVSQNLDARAKAYVYFNSMREEGTREEKESARH